jgi:hypothetical protein
MGEAMLEGGRVVQGCFRLLLCWWWFLIIKPSDCSSDSASDYNPCILKIEFQVSIINFQMLIIKSSFSIIYGCLLQSSHD